MQRFRLRRKSRLVFRFIATGRVREQRAPSVGGIPFTHTGTSMATSTQLTWLGGDVAPTPFLNPQPPSVVSKPSVQQYAALAMELRAMMENQQPITSKALFRCAEAAFGGTPGSGAATASDAYEALHLAVNLIIADDPQWSLPADFAGGVAALTALEALEARLPTQSTRTPEMESHQQFSTPPAYASVIAWLAAIRPDDIVLEPSIGTGSVAAFACATGATVIGNELAPRRAALARLLPGVQVVTEANADHLSALAPRLGLSPASVVLMNPPFSATAGRLDHRDTMTAARHISEAFALLRPGGRLVAIVPDGMAISAPRYQDWWAQIAAEATVAAHVSIPGSVYRRYGTTVATRIIVLDRPQVGDQPRGLSVTVLAYEKRLKKLPHIRLTKLPG